MIIYEFKVKGKDAQYRAIAQAIRTSQFIQNKCLRYWMDNEKVGRYRARFAIGNEKSIASELHTPSSNLTIW